MWTSCSLHLGSISAGEREKGISRLFGWIARELIYDFVHIGYCIIGNVAVMYHADIEGSLHGGLIETGKSLSSIDWFELSGY